MVLYLSVSTDLADLVIDYIEVRLVTGETVSLNWDESDIERLDTGKLDSLRKMQIDKIGIYADSGSYSDIVITEMIFEDAGEQYDMERFLPYVTDMGRCTMS